MSSSVVFLAAMTLSELVVTSIPSATGYTHAATMLRAPLTSTMQILHAPMALMSFR